MNDGLLVLDKEGTMLIISPKTFEMLGLSEDVTGQKFAMVFLQDEKNDEFCQTVLDAIYEPEVVHNTIVPYESEEQIKYLKVTTSGLTEDKNVTGVIVVISDITELTEVKEHLKMMHQIEALNEELQKRNNFIREVFGRYLSDEVVDKILDSPDGLAIGGRMANITALISDLRGFTAICEKMDPDSLIHMLNNYFQHMAVIIKEMRGTIIEYEGDGILAIFGEPVKCGNHAENAVKAAIMMQQALIRLNEWNREKGYPELRMGIGINTGDAVVGNVGSEFAVRYNVIGSAVNLAGRIESYTTAGKIFISEDTKAAIAPEVMTDGSFKVMPKGVKKSVTIYSVKGLGEPVNISFEVPEAEIVSLEHRKHMTLKVLDGKHISDVTETAVVTGMSDTRIKFTASAPLDLFDNIVLSDGHDIYGKVTGMEYGDYIMTITGEN
ncbi:MAG: PAS domain S-box protein [Lachnospiraceae bacterium]|nr:PAS domain S-box protein [Lachnospiraceae bacterium]